jgi:hypothetical protein
MHASLHNKIRYNLPCSEMTFIPQGRMENGEHGISLIISYQQIDKAFFRSEEKKRFWLVGHTFSFGNHNFFAIGFLYS